MTAVAENVAMTLEEFLAWEEAQEGKHEFYDGEAFAMAGGTWGHTVLSGNTYMALRRLLDPRGCIVGIETMKVIVGQRSFYPDIVAVCGKSVEFSDSIARNPTLLVEVLSESTAEFDKGKKWDNYQKIPSLQAYVMIAQDYVSVECYERSGTEWRYNHWTKRTDELVIPSLNLRIPLPTIYGAIDVPEPN